MKAFFQKHTVVLVLLLILSIPLTLQTFHSGFFGGDDGEWMIIRSSAFHEALRDGQFPVRYLGRLNHEFGYPVATFLYPGYLYLTEPLVISGLSFIDSIKLFFALTMIGSGIFTYLWLSKLFDKWAAFFGSLVYLYTPYHLVDMYERGSLGELLALSIVPFVLWNIERRSMILSSLGIAGLIVSHNIMAALFLPIVFVYAFIQQQKNLKKRVLSVGLLLAASLGSSAFFWIPAIFELSYTIFHQTKISEWQNYFASFVTIGIVQLLLLAITVILIIKKQKHSLLPIFFLVLGLFAVFLSSSLSSPLWFILPVSFIQFPFRFLSVEVLACAFLTGYIFTAIKHKTYRKIYVIFLLVTLTIAAYPFLSKIQFTDKEEGFYVTNQSTTTTHDEYMPVWVQSKPTQRVDEKVTILEGTGEISSIAITNKRIQFAIIAPTDTQVQISKVYWPGWNAKIDEIPTNIQYNNPKGLMTLAIPKGNHTVILLFEETLLRFIADSISVISIGIVMSIPIVFNRRKKQS